MRIRRGSNVSIVRLKLRNFVCYRGEHVLELGPKVYAVVARATDNPERSNWLGKSILLEASPLVLYGEHRFRTEDEWITRGENFGEVAMTLSNGVEIRRVRERGKRTTLYYTPPGDARNTLIQDEAQAAIDRLVGLTWDDFRATCFFEQRAMSRFILTEPGKRMDIVSAWMKLGPLEKCEEIAKRYARANEDRAKEIIGALKTLDEREKAIGTREEIHAKIPQQEKELEEASGAVAALQDRIQANAALIAARENVRRYDALVEEGKQVRAEVDKRKLPVLRQADTAATLKLREADIELGQRSRDHQAKQKLARGQFDGACPVAGIECPAKDPINAAFARNTELEKAAREHVDSYRQTRHDAMMASGDARARLQEAERLVMRLEALREQVKRIQDDAERAKKSGEPADPTELRTALQNAQHIYQSVRDQLGNLKRGLIDLDGIDTTRARLLEEQAKLSKVLGMQREAVVIFGKKGAQRRVAEGSLAQIEEDANKVLEECSVKLRVDIRWAREGKGVAKTCDACGNPFPSSTKVKHCERCGAVRGAQLENKLDIVLSDRSGAAEDLAGGGVQLAASRWLRDVRETDWGSAFLDEPFGALDAAHRKAFANHLAAMLSGRYGFEQAFVVAHHASVLDSLPGRIEIIGGPDGSVPRVIA
jgi:DNA repair exonuclease SbcCD ATPase subunit